MANPKRGALAQFTVPMRQSSDGSVCSTLTASDFNSGATCKWYGVNHGGSAATTSGTMSKIASLVHSGVLRFTLKGTENNYDQMMLRINKASSPALKETIITWANQDYDDSDLYSYLSDMASDIRSVLIVNQSAVSDIYSLLSDHHSDFQSRVPKAVATNSQLSDLASDLKSYLAVMSGVQSDIYSAVSDFQSDFQSRVPKRVATDSQLSDMASDLKSYLAVMSGVLSDAYSAISDLSSDLRSVAIVNQSAVSDIYSLLSDHHSDFQSRVPKLVATNSQLSDLASDVKSAVAAVTFSLSASDISDIGSAVVAALPVTSILSDIYSLLSDFQSDFQSRVPKRVATDSQLSDLASDLRSYLVGISGQVSDVESQLDLVPTVNNSAMLSDVYSLLSDMQSDFQSRVPKAVATNSQLSDLASDLRSFLVVMSGIQSDIYSNLAAGVTVGASSISDIQSAILTNAMTESYRGTNAAPTLAQGIFEILAHMGECSIASTTKTLKKLDGTTTAKTYTLNDATTPTSITETT